LASATLRSNQRQKQVFDHYCLNLDFIINLISFYEKEAQLTKPESYLHREGSRWYTLMSLEQAQGVIFVAAKHAK